MKFFIQKTNYFGLCGHKTLAGIIFALTLSVLSLSTAHADRDDYGRGNWGFRGDWHGDRDDWRGYRGGWSGDRDDWRYRNGYGGYYQPGYQQPYGYAQPLYVPPPVYYPPVQSPGISLFFPFQFRR